MLQIISGHLIVRVRDSRLSDNVLVAGCIVCGNNYYVTYSDGLAVGIVFVDLVSLRSLGPYDADDVYAGLLLGLNEVNYLGLVVYVVYL